MRCDIYDGKKGRRTVNEKVDGKAELKTAHTRFRACGPSCYNDRKASKPPAMDASQQATSSGETSKSPSPTDRFGRCRSISRSGPVDNRELGGIKRVKVREKSHKLRSSSDLAEAFSLNQAKRSADSNLSLGRFLGRVAAGFSP
jgi:hypothetical protein